MENSDKAKQASKSIFKLSFGKINPTNAAGAAVEAIQKQIGQNIQDHIAEKFDSVTAFSKKSGVSTSSLYRLFNGENISIDNLLRVLKTAKMDDALSALLSPPDLSPAEVYLRKNKGQSPSLPDAYKKTAKNADKKTSARSVIEGLTTRK